MVKNKKINEYVYMVAVIGGSVLLSILLGLILGRPLYKSLQETNSELNNQKQVLERLETNLQNLKSLESRKAEIVEKNQRVLAALPNDKDIPGLFVQLERIANNAGLQITNVGESSSVTSGATTGSSQIVPVYYSVSGTATNYSGLKEALKKIESGLRLVMVEKLDVQGEIGQPLTINLTVKTYTRGQ